MKTKLKIENFKFESNQIDNNPVQTEFQINSTLINYFRSQSIQTVNHTINKSYTGWSSYGQNIFTIYIFLFYAGFLTLVLYMNIKPYYKAKPNGLNPNRKKNEYLMKSIRQQIDIKSNKTLLEELKNKQFRKKAWEIYRSEKQLKLVNEEIILKDIDKKLENILKSSESELNLSQNRQNKETKKPVSNEIFSNEENVKLIDPNKTSISSIDKINNLVGKKYENDLIESNNSCYFTKSANSFETLIESNSDAFDQSAGTQSNTANLIPFIIITDTDDDPFKYRKSSTNSSSSDKKSSSDKFLRVQKF